MLNAAQSVIPILAITLGALYGRGIIYRRRLVPERVSGSHTMLFVAGLCILLVSTLPPLAGLATRLFSVDQFQHMALRLLGPILIVLAHPAPVLMAGLPRPVRRKALQPFRNRLSRMSIARPVWHAPLVLFLFVVTISLAELPPVQNAAVALPSLRLGLHLALLAFGLLLFTMLFDPGDLRDGVVATAQGARIYLLFGVILSNILIGALTTLKDVVVYTGYDANGRAALTTPMADEAIGGYTIWVPSSMLCIIAIIVVFVGWNRAEERQYARRFDWSASNSSALMFPETAEELRMKVADPNRKMAQTLAMGSAFIFALVLSTVITIATFL